MEMDIFVRRYLWMKYDEMNKAVIYSFYLFNYLYLLNITLSINIGVDKLWSNRTGAKRIQRGRRTSTILKFV